MRHNQSDSGKGALHLVDVCRRCISDQRKAVLATGLRERMMLIGRAVRRTYQLAL